MNLDFSPSTLYRIPWNLTDNALSWLEPTSKCNLYCDGCYRENRINSHKSLDEVAHELDVFAKYRKSDSISVAGGEPLTHPDICEIVRMITKRGWKSVINTNGILIDRDILKELKKAGNFGFTLHVDSGQNRPNWKGKNELELLELRQQLADMLAEFGFSCSFNATVYPENIKYIPELAKWAHKNIDKVHVMVFIIYRMALVGKDIDFFVKDEQVFFDDMMYSKEDDNRRIDVQAPEVVAEIRKAYPDFMPCAFLNGTHKPDSYKWLLTTRIGNKHKIFGYAGPKFMETVQMFSHFFTGGYLAYASPKTTRKGRLLFLLSFLDKGVRKSMFNYLGSLFTNPKAFFSRVHNQSVMIIQPADFMPTGEVNMCDGCPDITVWNDELVWSCRMEEQMRWGQNVRMVPRREK